MWKSVKSCGACSRLQPGFDNEVSLMVLRREGGRMVAKLQLEDPNVRGRFQRLLDLTHRPRGDHVVQCDAVRMVVMGMMSPRWI